MYSEFIKNRDQNRALAEGVAITASLLLAEHLRLWKYRGGLPLPVRYALGVAAILAGVTHVLETRGDRRTIIELLIITGAAGAVVTGAHLCRLLAHYGEERRDDLAAFRRHLGA